VRRLAYKLTYRGRIFDRKFCLLLEYPFTGTNGAQKLITLTRNNIYKHTNFLEIYLELFESSDTVKNVVNHNDSDLHRHTGTVTHTRTL